MILRLAVVDVHSKKGASAMLQTRARAANVGDRPAHPRSVFKLMIIMIMTSVCYHCYMLYVLLSLLSLVVVVVVVVAVLNPRLDPPESCASLARPGARHKSASFFDSIAL